MVTKWEGGVTPNPHIPRKMIFHVACVGGGGSGKGPAPLPKVEIGDTVLKRFREG